MYIIDIFYENDLDILRHEAAVYENFSCNWNFYDNKIKSCTGYDGGKDTDRYSSIKFQSRSYRVSIFIEIGILFSRRKENERAVYPSIKRIKGLAGTILKSSARPIWTELTSSAKVSIDKEEVRGSAWQWTSHPRSSNPRINQSGIVPSMYLPADSDIFFV